MADPTLGFTLAQQGTSLSDRGTSSAQSNPNANPNARKQEKAPTVETLRYPYAKLDKNDDYLHITIRNYEPPGVDQGLTQPSSDENYGTAIAKKYIMLPVPQSVRSANATSWNADTMGPLAGAAFGAASGIIGGQGIEALTNTAVSLGGALTGSSMVQKALQTQFAGSAVKALLGQDNTGSSAGGILSRTTGSVFNQNIELLFQGVSLREAFVISYDLIPRSQTESDQIKKIIRTFKQEMSGRKDRKGAAGGVFIQAPSVFRLQYKSGNKQHPYLNRFKMCALLGINVDYTGSGTYATYSDATPVHIKIDLTFQELTPIYAEDYDTPEGKEGTGY